MHKPLPQLLPVAAAFLTNLKTVHPSSSNIFFGKSLFSHVSIKNMTLQTISLLSARVQVLSLSNFFAREDTLLKKMLGSISRCVFSLSLGYRPRFPFLCLWSRHQRRTLLFGESCLSWIDSPKLCWCTDGYYPKVSVFCMWDSHSWIEQKCRKLTDKLPQLFYN